jgi:hypothetical protein
MTLTLPIVALGPLSEPSLTQREQRMSKSGDARPRPLDEIARLDRRWFRAHPERRHRCRRPDTRELDLYAGDDGGRLIIAVRHLGHGRVLHQPLMLQGVLPADERSAAALFALAVKHPDPIPQLATPDWLTVRYRPLRLSVARHAGMARDL